MLHKYCLTLDLKNDKKLIAEYEAYHRNIWPEVRESINEAGIVQMQIYRFRNRLFMILEVNESFSFEAKALADETNEKVQQWEQLMWQYQQALPFAKTGEKWVLMNKIFELVNETEK